MTRSYRSAGRFTPPSGLGHSAANRSGQTGYTPRNECLDVVLRELGERVNGRAAHRNDEKVAVLGGFSVAGGPLFRYTQRTAFRAHP